MAGFTRKCSELALRAYVKADTAKDRAKEELSELANNELGVSGIVVSLILIAIAVGLALLFKDQIASFMQDIFDNTDTSGLGDKAEVPKT
jgi:dipeptide/tripeptide permease